LHLACVSSGTYGPFATSASRSRLRLPRTTRLALRASLAGSESKKNRFVNESVLFALSQFMKFINIRELSTGTSLINKVKHDRMNVYAATLIFDNVPDDDSVSGYRYDIQLNNHLPGRWELTEVRESWRCWEGRGHRVFSVSPCS